MADGQTLSAQDITPEVFREMVKDSLDEEILTGVKGNEEAPLDGREWHEHAEGRR